MEDNEIKSTIFKDNGIISEKNTNWFISNDLIVDCDENATTVKMPNKGLFIYSPNVIISGDFVLSVDILMPEGNSFLTFGFNDNQKDFLKYKGWWKNSRFEKLYIKRTDGYIKYFLNNEFKTAIELDLDEIYFQFRLYSSSKGFEFKFKNFQICFLNYSPLSNEYLFDKFENINIRMNLLKSTIGHK